jgi:hypothetical protein
VKSFNPDFPPVPSEGGAPTIFRSSYLDPVVPTPPSPVPSDLGNGSQKNFQPLGSKPPSVNGEKPASVINMPVSVQGTPQQLPSNGPPSVLQDAAASKAPSVEQMPPNIASRAASLREVPMNGPNIASRAPSVEQLPPNIASRPASVREFPPNNVPSVRQFPQAPQDFPGNSVPNQSFLQQQMGFPPQSMYAPQNDVSTLMSLNFDLQSKLDKAVSRIRKLESEQKELLDRFEKSVVIAAKLKNIENEKNEISDKFCESEKALREAYSRISQLEQIIESKSELLGNLREKYFTERERNDKQAVEIEAVKKSADLAKREIDNQIQRANLRELQLSTARNLIETGSVVSLQQEVAKVSNDDELRMAGNRWNPIWSTTTIDPIVEKSKIHLTGWKEWQQTPTAPSEIAGMSPEGKRIFLNGSTSFGGIIWDDRNIRVSISVIIQNNNLAIIDVVATNIGPGIIQSVRILSATRNSSFFEFIVQPINEPFLKPGQHVSSRCEFKLSGIYSDMVPTVCVSYTASGDLPKNIYLGLPLEFVKFVRPTSPDTESLLSKWAQFENDELCVKFPFLEKDKFVFSEIANMVECGGCLMPQRGLDPNPRGQILAGIYGNDAKEIIVRVELTPPDHRGPPMIRLTVRSPLLTLSKSILNSLLKLFSPSRTS